MDWAPSGSRRLTGPNLFLDGQGVVLHAPLPATDDGLVEAWRRQIVDLWEVLGWGVTEPRIRRFAEFLALAAPAPEDVLYTACEANETAWAEAVQQDGGTPAEHLSRDELRQRSAAERSPTRLAIAAEARRRGIRFLADDELVTVGSGSGGRSYPVDALPDAARIPWDDLSDIPVALITGTNGKTTTVRMLAAIARAADVVAGNTSTDGVQVSRRTVLEGDYTGGEGARTLLRDPQVETAFLEVARGGMLRRGLPVLEADVAYVSNIGMDHLGEWGIDTLDQLAEVKLLVAQAVEPDGTFVVNADDPRLQARLGTDRSVAVSLQDEAPAPAFVRRRGRLGRLGSTGFVPWLEAGEIPATLGGAAWQNIANALAAMAIATAMGFSREAVVEGLSGFGAEPAHNPGRSNLFQFGGLRVLVDFAHTPEGLELLLGLAERLRPQRTLLVIGQAGDRTDAAIDALADVAAARSPDRVIVKDMARYARGRDPGEVSARLLSRLAERGVPADRTAHASSETRAVRDALNWGRDGDLLLLTSHAARNEVLDLMQCLREADWKPGDSPPAACMED